MGRGSGAVPSNLCGSEPRNQKKRKRSGINRREVLSFEKAIDAYLACGRASRINSSLVAIALITSL
jgi:hypothetical protein